LRLALAVPVAIVAIVSVGCGSSGRTPSSATSAGPGAAAPWWLATNSTSNASGAATSSAVVNGFRVHPDPGDDGVIRAFEGENVVVNAADLASRPPAPESYLIVNWGDGPNQRVGCGPCRLEHGYSAGRYTLVATADDLQPTTAVPSSTNRSISLVVEVSPQREIIAPIQPFEFVPRHIGVGETAFLRIPFFLPVGVTLTSFSFPSCSPSNAAIQGPPVFLFPIFELPFTGNVPGTCTFSVSGTDGAGTPFKQTANLTIH
jgi:hypothetical protein